MRRRRLLIVTLVLAAAVGSAALGLHSRSRGSVEIIRDQSLGADRRAVTFGLRHSDEGYGSFLSNRYQARLGGHWTEPRTGGLVGNGVVCDIPAGADACRLLLKEFGWSRSHRAYLFLERFGLPRRLPAFCEWVVTRFPDKPVLRDVTVEISLPRRANNDLLRWTASSRSSSVPTATSLAAPPRR
jgi:hypothetical protein